MGALRARQLAEAAHNAVADVSRENFCAVASLHHRKQIEESVFEGSHRRRIARTMSLRKLMLKVSVISKKSS